MVDIVFVALLVVHIGSIISWMGGAVLFASVISPSIASMSAVARGEFITATLPRYLRFVGSVSILAVIAGLSLYGYMVYSNIAPTGAAQISLSAGALLGLIVLIIFFAVGRPAGQKMVALVKQMGQGPSPDLAGQLGAQARKAAMTARVGVALLGITMILMVLGAEL